MAYWVIFETNVWHSAGGWRSSWSMSRYIGFNTFYLSQLKPLQEKDTVLRCLDQPLLQRGGRAGGRGARRAWRPWLPSRTAPSSGPPGPGSCPAHCRAGPAVHRGPPRTPPTRRSPDMSGAGETRTEPPAGPPRPAPPANQSSSNIFQCDCSVGGLKLWVKSAIKMSQRQKIFTNFHKNS